MICQDEIERGLRVQKVQSRLWRDAVGVTSIVMWIDPISYRGRNRDCSSSDHSRKAMQHLLDTDPDENGCEGATGDYPPSSRHGHDYGGQAITIMITI